MAKNPHSEGELLFLTDSAYLSLFDEQPTPQSNGKQKHDGLFLERLDSFIEGQIRDMATFAEREQHPLDEIRKLVAISHAKFLFSQNDADDDDFSTPSVRSTLARLSSNLQTLHGTSGLESLLLAVAPSSVSVPTAPSPSTSAEVSWIGGTELGKEFWMGLKGGGVVGVRAFRAKCHATEPIGSTSGHTHPRSSDIKTELNAAVRHALRTASGNPSAEMRWTRPAALEDAYNVRVRGWPADIVQRNPSNNTMRENMRLLECIRNGSLRFVPRGTAEWEDAAHELNDGSTIEGSRSVEDSRRGDQPLESALPVASPQSATDTHHDETSSQFTLPPFHLAAALGHAEIVKRPAESVDSEQDRRTRRKTDAQTG